MLGLSILSIFILIIIAIIVSEVRNERKYQEKRRNKRESTEKRHTKKFPKDSKTIPIKKVPELKSEPISEPIKEEKKLPHCNYPQFTHARLLEMGLSDEEAKDFVQELIPQIEAQIPLIEESLAIPDFYQMERLTHGIKGSATNLGTGGISDLLVEYNTYLKTGTDRDVAEAYFGYLKHYTQELKEQYT